MFSNCWPKYIHSTPKCYKKKNNALIISDLDLWTRWCFHLNTVFTTELELMRRIKSLHLNVHQSQEALANHQEQGQHHQ